MTTLDLITRPTRKYGITESKKAELDLLSSQVIDAQHDVDQLQAVVVALTDKANKCAGYLALSDTALKQALSNKNQLDALVQNALDLMNNSKIAFNETVVADAKTKMVAIEVKRLIDKLIYSAEVINKLSNFIVRKKAMNPLISDELVSIISQAGKDANAAVALTLTALNSAFTSQASTLDAEAASALEYTQSMKLYEVLTTSTSLDNECLKDLIYAAYTSANESYYKAMDANTTVQKQLAMATSDLTKAQIKLKSLQSGLAAANAAALAS